MAYPTISDIDSIINFPSSATDDQKNAAIKEAYILVNNELMTDVNGELISGIDNVRTNKVDGDNDTFYLSRVGFWYGDEWSNNYLGDKNNDGDVDTDDITVYIVYDDERTNGVLSSIDATNGKFTLDTAPESGSTVYVDYSFIPINYDNPRLIDCIAHFTMGYVHLNLSPENYTSISLKNILTVRSDTPTVDNFFNTGKRLLDSIKRDYLSISLLTDSYNDINLYEVIN